MSKSTLHEHNSNTFTKYRATKLIHTLQHIEIQQLSIQPHDTGEAVIPTIEHAT